MKILLICSSGGHFQALRQLEPFWQKHDRYWVTFHSNSSEEILKQEKKSWGYSPTNRNLLNLVRNLVLAIRVFIKEKPELTLTTGAGIAVPFIALAKIFGSKTVFVESITRIEDLSLSARLVLPFIDLLYVYWPQIKERYPQAQVISLEPLQL